MLLRLFFSGGVADHKNGPNMDLATYDYNT